MKFSISFKYSNVTFKNKETKETIAYDTKASEGNTFTFDNVDEDVVIGMLKGIKDRKASQLFAYDDLRTNFINVMARNKCKELYDKLDKAEWKIEDIAISNITIKDIEFTKPTMNAREAITVESISRKNYTKGAYPTYVVKKRLVDLIEGCPRENPMWADLVEILEKYYGEAELEKVIGGKKMMESNEFKPGDLVDWFVPEDDDRYGKDFGGEVFHGGEVYKKQGDVYEVSFGEEGLFYPQGKDLEYHSENLMESRKMKKLNITKEQFNRSRYFKNKYGRLEYVSESGKLFKTNKGKVLMFKESADQSLEDIIDNIVTLSIL